MNLNKRLNIATIAGMAAIACAPAAFAQEVTLDFEGLENREGVEAYYGGGAGSLGSSGPDHGVIFAPEAMALIDTDAGGTGNIANEPSPDTVLAWASGPSLVMNVPNGFSSRFAFYYSASASATVTLYDGVDGTGSVVDTVTLQAQHNDSCTGDPDGDFCNWNFVSVNFTGVVRSVDFSGTADLVGFDDITLGAANNASAPVSIPSMSPIGLLLLSGGLGLVGLAASTAARRSPDRRR